MPHTELGIFYVLSVLHLDGNHLIGEREYWLQEHEEALTAERARLLERI